MPVSNFQLPGRFGAQLTLCAMLHMIGALVPSAAVAGVDGTLATGFVYHTDYTLHDTGPGHPERPARVEAIARALRQSPMWRALVPVAPRVVSATWLSTVHSLQYLDQLRDAAAHAPLRLDADTVMSSHSYRVALLAAGGALAAVDAVMQGRIRNAFVASRPPGHHAFPERASGFCLINNVAVATRYVQQKHGLKRVLIVDWDVHHGNATQDLFYDDPSVLYFSTHQFPHYPGTGRADEVGAGSGRGTTVNVPLPAGSGDAEVIEAFETKLLPAAKDFHPQFVFISAGFDSHAGDPLAGFEITTAGFARLTEIVKNVADQFAEGRLVSILEGGYDLANLASASVAHVEVLAESR